jgi:spore coat protein H
VDNAAAYLDTDFGPVTISLTAPDGQALTDVESATVVKAPIVFTATDYGDGTTSSGGTIELHGSTSRAAIQKSFQIKLATDALPWRGTRIINLLKHPFDLTRVRNGLSFASFRAISSFTSLRTGLVHLSINAVDRGLYEWVEEPDQNFLAAHGLDPSGALYKAKLFSFLPIDGATAADPAKVAAIVSTKGTPDLAKLRRMVAAVNDTTQPINDVIAHYFNRDNYITWLAVNMLMADFDSGSQNFILYSPSGFEGWYFLPWDYDGAWGWNDQPGSPARPRWRQGLSNWWWIALHQRFLSDPANLADLDARIGALVATTLTEENTSQILGRYHDIVASFISMQPDINNLPCDQGGTPAAIPLWQAESTRIAGNVSGADAEYAGTLGRPMPFWLYAPAFGAQGVTLSWSPSFQLRGQALSYDLEINGAETFDPASVVATETALTAPQFTTAALSPGHYFWRVIARSASDPANDWQMAFDDHQTVDVP